MNISVRNALEIENKGGVVLASQWTTGSRTYTKKRPVPMYCEELLRSQVSRTKGKTRRAFDSLLKKHPQAQKFICVMDRRRLLKAVRIADARPLKTIQDILSRYETQRYKKLSSGEIAIRKDGKWWYFSWDDARRAYVQGGMSSTLYPNP